MVSWRDEILEKFTPGAAKLTLVADPDGLLLEEQLLETIRARGFELIPFEDHAAFRFAYETRFRARWDRGEATDLVVVLRAEEGNLDSLPYDLLETGRRVTINLGKLFSNLSYPVVAALDKGDLDALDKALREFPPGNCADNATKDFILQHVYGMVPNLVTTPAGLLRDLLQFHYRGQSLPPMINDRLIEVLRQKEAFSDWPLERIVPERESFLAFLQERWPLFLQKLTTKTDPGAREKQRDFGFELPGPEMLPFDHDDVRVYMNALFQEGLLKPVRLDQGNGMEGAWVQAGIANDQAMAKLDRFDALARIVDERVPGKGARYLDWIEFALRWAELKVRQHQCGTHLTDERFEKFQIIQKTVDSAFEAWIDQRYAGLANLPATTPAMVHHIPRHLSRMLQKDPESKIALVVIDGLSMDQWFVAKERLDAGNEDFRYDDRGIFAWLPTLTGVSRQAIFSGDSPMYFPASIKGTDKEPAFWKRFWENFGLNPMQIAYTKLKGNKEELRELEMIVASGQVKALGVVITKLDKIIHGMELGTAGMHNQVRQWTGEGFPEALFGLLLTHGYRVIVTSDHGNIEASGCGRPNEGAVSDVKGERVRVFDSEGLRKQVADKFPGSLCWPTIGLPDGFLPLFAPKRKAFIPEKEITVCHGSISLEEVIVPLVQIKWR